MKKKRIRAVCVGIGEMGKKLVKTILNKNGIIVVGAIDTNPELIGKDLSDVLSLDQKTGIKITNDAKSVFSKVKADVGLYCTVTSVEELYYQILPAFKAGCDVISTSEILSFPWRKAPGYSKKIDRAAKKYGTSILGTGVCPGFIPDVLPMIASAGSSEIQHIDIKIFGDVYPYGRTVWKGMGLGLTPDNYYRQLGKQIDIEFSEPPEHVATAIGWKLDKLKEKNEALIAPFEIKVGELHVKKGNVCGFSHTTIGYINKKEVIRQNVHGPICSNLPPFAVEINIKGKPDVKLHLELIHEDGWATSNMIANTIPKVINAKAGLISMKDLTLPCSLA